MALSRTGRLLMALMMLLSSTGCITSLAMSEERQWGRLLERQVVREPIPFKSKMAAGFWSAAVPGVGHFYVDEPGLGVAYFLGNLLWPLNPFWTLPAGLQAATVTNKRRTIEYYMLGAHEKAIAKLQKKSKLPQDFMTYQVAKTILEDKPDIEQAKAASTPATETAPATTAEAKPAEAPAAAKESGPTLALP